MNDIKQCSSCGADIVWMKTMKDKNICVDVPDEDDPLRDEVLTATLFDRNIHKTHFETCPNAAKHRGTQSRTATPPSTDASVNAKRLNTALAVLEDIAAKPADGMRAIELAKTGLAQIRGIR